MGNNPSKLALTKCQCNTIGFNSKTKPPDEHTSHTFVQKNNQVNYQIIGLTKIMMMFFFWHAVPLCACVCVHV